MILRALGTCVRRPLGLLRAARLRVSERFLEVPVEIITDQFGFSFADHGWHFFREIAASYEHDPELSLRESPFFRFFEHDRVRAVKNLNDLLFLHDARRRAESSGAEFYLGTQPWGDWFLRDDVTGGQPWGHYYDAVEGKSTRDLYGYRRNPWYDPGDEYPLAIEWEQTIALYRSLARGYRPALYGSYPEVVMLARKDGERRAVVAQGQHRVAVLSQLGHERITMVMTRDSMGTIHEDDVAEWHFVRNKKCTPEQALSIFHSFFELDGRERIAALGIDVSY